MSERYRLDEMGIACGTDKASSFHDYLDVYDFWLHDRRHSIKKVLEIGIAAGASLRMWQDYFPAATIWGVDVRKDFVDRAYGPRIKTAVVNANDPQAWQAFFHGGAGGAFDLIVDDGGHTALNMITAFESCWPQLARGGFYFVEDLHASYDPGYNRDGLGAGREYLGQERQAVRYFQNLVNVINEWGHGQCGKPSGGCDIDFLMFTKSLAVMGKGVR